MTDKTTLPIIKDSNGCWLWVGRLSSNGYGQVNRSYQGKKYYIAHRLSYAIHKGDPGSNDVDHLCHVRRCVNPEHLNAVDPKINRGRNIHWNTRKTECKRGHAIGRGVPGKRRPGCIKCRRERR